MHKNLYNILLALQDKTQVEDADLGRLIFAHAGIQRRTVIQYHNFLTENALVYRCGQRKYRVNRKKVRRMLAAANYNEDGRAKGMSRLQRNAS